MQAGDVIDDRFVIERVTGSGGMGSVFRAHDRLSGGPVAVKVLHDREPHDIARFDMEARVLAGLDHPGIVRYVTHGVTSAGEPFLAMEWLAGEDLGERLARGRLTVEESVAVISAAASALATAHARGVVHRDIKPSNVFLVDGALGRVKLLDFGLARMPLSPRFTRTGVVLGTPSYMAPEQARGSASLDARVDVFALGAVLFECLTGQPAFQGEHVMAILAKVLLEDPPPLRKLRPEVSVRLEALVACILAKDPADRLADAGEVAEALACLDARDAWSWLSEVPPAEALTRSEQRLLCIVAVGPPAGDVDAEHTSAYQEVLESAAERFGARIEWLADGSTLVVFMNATSASDAAARAAQCALWLRPRVPDAPIAMATGLGEVAEALPVGQVLDRAAALLRAAGRWVLVDEVTAGLFDARLVVVRGPGGIELHREEEVSAAARTLLGKPSPFVGRGRELRALLDLLDESVGEGVARAVLVTGPPGIGKSRLRQEFVRAALQHHPAVDVWIGRGDAMSKGSAFSLVGSALRYAFAVAGHEPIEERRRKLTERVARHVAEAEVRHVAGFLGEMTGTSFPDADSARLRAARLDARLMADQIQSSFRQFMAAACGAHPVLLVLEDLHWGDLPSVKLVDAALRDLAGKPLVVAAFGRPDVHDVFPKVWAERGLSEIRLGELTPRAAEELARSALGDAVDPRTIAQIVKRAGGHPFFLEELIRAVAEGHGEQLPETVLAMVEARLAALPAGARRVLRAASVFGEVFWCGGVEHLLGGGDEALGAHDWLDMLATREVLQRSETSRFPGEEQYSFRHSLLREGAYAMLTEPDRTLGHRLAGEWFLQWGEGDAMRLAEHFERGKSPERAAAWYLAAARQMLQANDLHGAIACAERGVGCGASGKLRTELLLARGEVRGWIGDWALVLPDMDEALRGLTKGEPFWYTAKASKVMNATLRDGASAVSDDVLAEFDVDPSPESARHFVYALGLLYQALMQLGKRDLAERCMARMEQTGSRIAENDPLIRGKLQEMRSVKFLHEGHFWASLTAAKACLESYEQAGDRRHLAWGRLSIDASYMHLGAYARVEEDLRALPRGDDDPAVYAVWGRCLLACTLAERGALDEARRLAENVRDSEYARSNLYLLGLLRAMLAPILLRSGELDAAEREARVAIEILSGAPLWHSAAMATLAAVLLGQQRTDEALRLIEDAAAQHDACGGGGPQKMALRLTHAEALHATGNHARARTVLLEARDLLLSRATEIEDPELRRSFLENVSVNARILALAAAWEQDAA
ncbi:serine/threonine-protein kinase [Polyangium jinanense]|uniref:Protein kinase n=1 Tax=Polyangium jinanense TaxID=2829994 RepID=A0A9X3XGT7_9BACT|nr:protein kinase [Polyangium jinanense]MDC3961861.1 protein kinase [Polyangium jinanense]MDC3987821.1 protein kinase [Polyangium jinanense]